MLRWVDLDIGGAWFVTHQVCVGAHWVKRTCLLLDAYIHQGKVSEGHVKVGRPGLCVVGFVTYQVCVGAHWV